MVTFQTKKGLKKTYSIFVAIYSGSNPTLTGLYVLVSSEGCSDVVSVTQENVRWAAFFKNDLQNLTRVRCIYDDHYVLFSSEGCSDVVSVTQENVRWAAFFKNDLKI